MINNIVVLEEEHVGCENSQLNPWEDLYLIENIFEN